MYFTSSHLQSQKGFTIMELIVGMTIFAISMTGILALLSTTIQNATYSRQEIIASNLLREQVELVKNIRNSNIRSFLPFDTVKNNQTITPGTYFVQNDFTSTGVKLNQNNLGWSDGIITEMPVSLSWVTLTTSNSGTLFHEAQLYFDDQWRYTHIHTSTGTEYASYMIIKPLEFQNGTNVLKVQKDNPNSTPSVPMPKINQWYILDARVIVKWNGEYYREYDLESVITDWK